MVATDMWYMGTWAVQKLYKCRQHTEHTKNERMAIIFSHNGSLQVPLIQSTYMTATEFLKPPWSFCPSSPSKSSTDVTVHLARMWGAQRKSSYSAERICKIQSRHANKTSPLPKNGAYLIDSDSAVQNPFYLLQTNNHLHVQDHVTSYTTTSLYSLHVPSFKLSPLLAKGASSHSFKTHYYCLKFSNYSWQLRHPAIQCFEIIL